MRATVAVGPDWQPPFDAPIFARGFAPALPVTLRAVVVAGDTWQPPFDAPIFVHGFAPALPVVTRPVVVSSEYTPSVDLPLFSRGTVAPPLPVAPAHSSVVYAEQPAIDAGSFLYSRGTAAPVVAQPMLPRVVGQPDCQPLLITPDALVGKPYVGAPAVTAAPQPPQVSAADLPSVQLFAGAFIRGVGCVQIIPAPVLPGPRTKIQGSDSARTRIAGQGRTTIEGSSSERTLIKAYG